MSVPVFAVVGHPNKGKSSMVATLAEQEDVAISPLPGTTRRAREFTFYVDGEPQYTLVDTPGFQRAREVALWLQDQGGDASARPGHVRRFVEMHRTDPRFVDEVELLQPIINGASILYVVDAAKPYGAEYELDMQILQWSLARAIGCHGSRCAMRSRTCLSSLTSMTGTSVAIHSRARSSVTRPCPREGIGGISSGRDQI